MATLDAFDVRLEYIVYMEEESDFLEGRLFAEDILFSFLFGPVSRWSRRELSASAELTSLA